MAQWRIRTDLNEKKLARETGELRKDFEQIKTAVLAVFYKHNGHTTTEAILNELSGSIDRDSLENVLAMLKTEGSILPEED